MLQHIRIQPYIFFNCLVGHSACVCVSSCAFQELSHFHFEVEVFFFLLIVRLLFAKSSFNLWWFFLVFIFSVCVCVDRFTSSKFLFIWLYLYGSYIHYPLLCFSNTHSQLNFITIADSGTLGSIQLVDHWPSAARALFISLPNMGLFNRPRFFHSEWLHTNSNMKIK